MKIHYEIDGKGHPLLLIAGYTASISIWNRIRNLLSPHFQLILFDNRGVGQSEAPDVPYSIAMMGEDALQLIQKLNLQKPHVLGHSMGGFIAQWLAFHHRDKFGKVILANTCIKSPIHVNLRSRALFHLREDNVSIERQVECGMPWSYSNRFLSQPDLFQDLIRGRKEDRFPQSLIGQKRQLEALEAFDSISWYRKILAPALVLTSDEDRLFPLPEAEKLVRGISGSQFHLFKETGHSPQIEAPDEFAAVVSRFLAASPHQP